MANANAELMAAIANGRHQLVGGGDYLLVRCWQGERLQPMFSLLQPSPQLSHLVIAEWHHHWPATAPVYGEGWQMLQQWRGTVGNLQAVGRCGDADTFHLYPQGLLPRLYNLLLVEVDTGCCIALAFADAKRFNGFFEVDEQRVRICVDLRHQPLAIGEVVALPEIILACGDSWSEVMADLAGQLEGGAVTLPPVAGWCSWYHYYAEVTASDIAENLAAMADFHGMEYLLIDDGYQQQMGDWLTASDRFDGGLGPLCESIRRGGKTPALWLAPFIASGQSRLLREHPDWFIHDQDGRPLAAEAVTYGGWRQTPWYLLDGSHPEVQAHFRQLFARLKAEFGIGLFKLDALLWGALPWGRRYDPTATANSGYRAGLQAMADGAAGVPLLGCNAPLWPSLGLVQLMRIGDDVERSRGRFISLGDELRGRRWGHRRLWLADPDCITLIDGAGQHASEADYRLHMAVQFAFAGVALSGDRLAALSGHPRRWLRQLLMMQSQGFDGVALDPLGDCWGSAPWQAGQVVVSWRSQGAGDWSVRLPPGRWRWHELLRDWQGEGEGSMVLASPLAAEADGVVLILSPLTILQPLPTA